MQLYGIILLVGRSDTMNYDLLMEQEIKSCGEGKTLLLHVCCAPCSSAVLERLGDIFKITIFFYNPNIDTLDEYNKRLEELKKFISSFKTKYSVELIAAEHRGEEFKKIALGLENEKERGPRCYKCYDLRLRETAKLAKEKHFDYFTTSLTLSPYKNSKWLNEIGENLQEEYQTNYLYSDFKKKNGYKRSIELSKEFDLYRQDYCGCIYSRRQKENMTSDM